MNTKTIGLVTLLFLAQPTLSASKGDTFTKFLSGSNLISNCESEHHQARCILYLQGVIDSFSTIYILNGMQNILCFPDNIEAIQLKKVFLKWANNHPEKLHNIAASLVINAFSEAFPCKE